MIDLIITSRALAGKILNNPNRHIDFLVSIGCPDRDPPSGYHRFPPERKLKLTFYDYIGEPQDYAQIAQQPYPPTVEDVQRILFFVQNNIRPAYIDGLTRPIVLVHCEVGISRSTATAQIILEELGLSEQEAIAEVLRVRPQAIPNQYLLQLYRATI